MSDAPHQAAREIERVWVLRSMPAVPPGAEQWTIDQGYLPHADGDSAAAGFPEGRLRRIERPDGSVTYRHTIKRGTGLVREEIERAITAEEYARWWPATAGRRIEKTRYRIGAASAGGVDLVWELDRFHGLPLVMLEVELPDERHAVELPAWARDLVVREVTDDPRYRNAALAISGLPNPL